MEIEVGDRVTYINNDKYITDIINCQEAKDVFNTDKSIEILKIERPKYEVVEEKKELLTEEEREFLKAVLKFLKVKIISIEIKIDYDGQGKEINFHSNLNESVSGYWYYIKDCYFKGLETNKEYTLKELRIGGLNGRNNKMDK